MGGCLGGVWGEAGAVGVGYTEIRGGIQGGPGVGDPMELCAPGVSGACGRPGRVPRAWGGVWGALQRAQRGGCRRGAADGLWGVGPAFPSGPGKTSASAFILGRSSPTKATATTCEWPALEVSVLGTVPRLGRAPPAGSGVVCRAQLRGSGRLLALGASGGIPAGNGSGGGKRCSLPHPRA